MTKKTRLNLTVSFLLIVYAIVLFGFNIYGKLSISSSLIFFLGTFAIINFIKYILLIEKNDIESLLLSISNILILLIIYLFNNSLDNVTCALSLFIWVIFISLIKLKVCQKYLKSNYRKWLFKVIVLILFIIIGLLTVVSFYYLKELPNVIFSYFVFIVGLLKLSDLLIDYYIKK